MKSTIYTFFLCMSIIFIANDGFCSSELRVVSLARSVTETIIQLGKTNTLVGRTNTSNNIKQVRNIPVVGDFGNPSLERVIRLKPNLVIGTMLKNPQIKETLSNLGIKVVILPEKSISDYFKNVNKLGKLLGAENEASSEIKRIKSGLEHFKELNKKIPEKERPKVFLEIWNKPMITAGNRSFLNECLSYAGGINIAANINKSYFNSTPEWVLLSAPDVIIAPSLSPQTALISLNSFERQSIPAVKDKRIYCNIDKNLIFVPGPNILKGIGELRNLIYQNNNNK